MESHPQNPEFRNNPENFHPCIPERFLSSVAPGMDSQTFELLKHLATFFTLILWSIVVVRLLVFL